MARLSIALAVLLAAAGVAWWWTARPSDDASVPAPDAAMSAESSASAAPSASSPTTAKAPRPAPQLPPPSSPGAELPLSERLLWTAADPARDPAWAGPTERKVRTRLDALTPGGDVVVSQLECRQSSCRLLAVGAPEPAVRRFVESLSGPDGFVGFAAAVALEAFEPEVAADGTERYAVRVRLVFEP